MNLNIKWSDRRGMLLIEHIIEKLGCLQFIGDHTTTISECIKLDPNNVRNDVIFWCNDKNIDKLTNIHHGTIICSTLALTKSIDDRCNLIIVENPRLYFIYLLKLFFEKKPNRQGISKTATIHPTSTIGEHCFIGEHVVIEENCVIEEHCFIGHNTVIYPNTIIKRHTTIGCNNTIGSVGFGYEKNEQGDYILVPHIGNVIIEEYAEIGNNTCIDRAPLGATHIGKNVKIDNLVHIGHGAQIGNNALIIANSMIGGSAIIGQNVWVAPSSAIINNITIGDNAVIGLSAVVLKSVEANKVVVGNPAKELIRENK